MAQHLGLAHLREAVDRLAQQLGRQQIAAASTLSSATSAPAPPRRLRSKINGSSRIDARLLARMRSVAHGRASDRREPLDLRGVVVHLGHGETAARRPARDTSVRADAGQTPRRCCARSERSRRVALPRTTNSLKNGPRSAAASARAAQRRVCARARARRLASASRRKPALPSSSGRPSTASAISPWLVQMFDVARSRRMCCSRVGERQHVAAPSVAVDRLADEPARHVAHVAARASRRGRRPGPPYDSGTPRLCPSPTAMSAPQRPGGAQRCRAPAAPASRVTSSAPAATRAAAIAARSSITPKKFG